LWCLLIFVQAYLALPDRPRDARWLTDEQKDSLERKLVEKSHPRAWSDAWSAVRDPRVLKYRRRASRVDDTAFKIPSVLVLAICARAWRQTSLETRGGNHPG
jgi:hypothetical protein